MSTDGTKVVEMNNSEKEVKDIQKPTYQELEQFITENFGKLHQENTQLKKVLANQDHNIALARIGFLFKILELKDSFPTETVAKVVEEISVSMFITPEDEDSEIPVD